MKLREYDRWHYCRCDGWMYRVVKDPKVIGNMTVDAQETEGPRRLQAKILRVKPEELSLTPN
jgi:hypothetical protein